MANVLKQTAVLRPSCQSKKIKNLFYTGQFTVPGPGVPPSLISGEVVSKQGKRPKLIIFDYVRKLRINEKKELLINPT